MTSQFVPYPASFEWHLSFWTRVLLLLGCPVVFESQSPSLLCVRAAGASLTIRRGEPAPSEPDLTELN